jgi:hypothetical protein
MALLDHILITSIDIPDQDIYLYQFNQATDKLEREVHLTDGGPGTAGGNVAFRIRDVQRSPSSVRRMLCLAISILTLVHIAK